VSYKWQRLCDTDIFPAGREVDDIVIWLEQCSSRSGRCAEEQCVFVFDHQLLGLLTNVEERGNW